MVNSCKISVDWTHQHGKLVTYTPINPPLICLPFIFAYISLCKPGASIFLVPSTSLWSAVSRWRERRFLRLDDCCRARQCKAQRYKYRHQKRWSATAEPWLVMQSGLCLWFPLKFELMMVDSSSAAPFDVSSSAPSLCFPSFCLSAFCLDKPGLVWVGWRFDCHVRPSEDKSTYVAGTVRQLTKP